MAVPVGAGEDYDITIRQGSTFTQSFTLKEATREEDGTLTIGDPIPLTGYSGVAQMRRRKKLTATLLLEFEVEVNQAGTGQAGCGEVVVTADAEDTTLVTRSGVYEVKLIKDGTDPPEIIDFIQGKALLDLQVTAVP